MSELTAWLREEADDWEPADDAMHSRTAAKLREAADALDAKDAEIARLTAERDEARQDVIAFCGVWAVQYAKANGHPDGHLHPTHYDILDRAGARMADFTRAEVEDTPCAQI